MYNLCEHLVTELRSPDGLNPGSIVFAVDESKAMRVSGMQYSDGRTFWSDARRERRFSAASSSALSSALCSLWSSAELSAKVRESIPNSLETLLMIDLVRKIGNKRSGGASVFTSWISREQSAVQPLITRLYSENLLRLSSQLETGWCGLPSDAFRNSFSNSRILPCSCCSDRA